VDVNGDLREPSGEEGEDVKAEQGSTSPQATDQRFDGGRPSQPWREPEMQLIGQAASSWLIVAI
jgi:hypothetical protein